MSNLEPTNDFYMLHMYDNDTTCSRGLKCSLLFALETFGLLACSIIRMAKTSEQACFSSMSKSVTQSAYMVVLALLIKSNLGPPRFSHTYTCSVVMSKNMLQMLKVTKSSLNSHEQT